MANARLTAAELARALGPKPQSAVLRKAVEVDLGDPDGFFRPLLDRGLERETVQEFAGKESNRATFQDRVVLVPLTTSLTPAEARCRVEAWAAYVAAFLAPLARVEVQELPQFAGPRQLRLFRDPQTARLKAQQLTMGLERARPAHAARLLAICLDCATDAGTSNPRQGAGELLRSADGRVGVLDLTAHVEPSPTSERAQLFAVCRATTYLWANLAPCAYFECLVNHPGRPNETGREAACVLCPLCLRKLSLVPGPPTFDVVARYVSLFEAAKTRLPALRTEAQWYAERLAHLGRYEFVDALDRDGEGDAVPRQEMATEPGPSRDTSKTMHADLQTLKRRMSASKSKARAPPIYFG